MVALKHSPGRKSLHWHAHYKLLNAKVGIFSLSYAVIPMFSHEFLRDQRNNEVQRPHTVSLLLRRIVALQCFVWRPGLQM